MPAARVIEARFPVGGVSKRLAYQSQPPFTTVDALNVRPEGTLEKRLRGGSRPGLVKSFAERDSDNKVRLLTVMRTHNIESRKTFEENFGSELSSNWDAGAWQQGLITISGAQGIVSSATHRGAILKNGAGEPGELVSTDNLYEVECWIDPSSLESTNSSGFDTVFFRVFARLDDTTPAFASGVYGEIRYFLKDDSYYAELGLFVDGVRQDVQFILAFADANPLGAGVLTLSIASVGDRSTAQWNPDPGSNGNFAIVNSGAATASTGKRVGLGAELLEADSSSGFFDNFRLRYISTAAGTPPEAVVQATNGVLRRETVAGALATVTQTGITLASDRALLAVDRLGKLYIADHGNRFSSDESEEARQTDGAITSANSDRLTTDGPSIADWTDMGIEAAGDWLEIISVGEGSAANIALAEGLHRLATQSNSGYLELVTGLGIDANISDITFRVTRGPKVYDSATNAMTIWVPTTGPIPLGCPIIEIFRDRAVFGGDPENPGIFFMSRSGNFDDYNYFASITDGTRAVKDLTTSSDGGQLSVPLSAIAAITEDYCIFSGEAEFFLLRGDRTLGGIMGNVSNQIGIGSRTAWCRIPDGSVVFLSRDGLYRFHPSQPFPESLSRDKLPFDLINIVQNTDATVTVEYDVAFRGVLIFIAFESTGATTHYWFDWNTQSFWPAVLANTDHDPFAITFAAKTNNVLIGCRDGYIRHHDNAVSDDDGTTINGHVFYGPFNLGGNGTRDGAIRDMHTVLDDNSGDAVVDVLVGDDPELASKASSFKSRTVSAGRSNRLPVRARGASGFVKISDSAGSRWAIDSLTLVTQRHGKARV